MPAATTDEEIARIQRAAKRLDVALMAVAAGALAFSTVTVAELAIDHGVPAWIAWMLEPLVGIALWAALSSDAVLARYGRASCWRAWLLRTFTGAATLTTNIWGSVFAAPRPGHLAWDPDPTGIVLHAIAPVLLILLAEAAPRYRAHFAAITTTLTSPDAATNRPDTAPTGVAGPPAHPAPATAHRGDHGPVPDPATADGTPGTTGGDHGQGGAAGGVRGAGPTAERPGRADREAAARALITDEPGITGAELARRLGLKTRTAQRIRSRISPTTTAEGS
ncbi:hypothetical protein GCM10023224_27240 [Streptomonospora halophila]|uniref:DUF2637 domain-containing protein n=1 Tax=Streptomonospora halophila TaxID=427369 RepID=A0ABP9GKB0_9ACTN